MKGLGCFHLISNPYILSPPIFESCFQMSLLTRITIAMQTLTSQKQTLRKNVNIKTW